MDEWLMERYSLAKGRIWEICTEKTIKETYADFFRKTAEFLKKQEKFWKERKMLFLWPNTRRRTEVFMKNCFRKIMGLPMEIPLMRKKRWGIMGRHLPFCMQSFGELLPMLMKKSGGIILYARSFSWKSILPSERKSCLPRKPYRKSSAPMSMTIVRI